MIKPAEGSIKKSKFYASGAEEKRVKKKFSTGKSD
jgi:hypothetical protein